MYSSSAFTLLPCFTFSLAHGINTTVFIINRNNRTLLFDGKRYNLWNLPPPLQSTSFGYSFGEINLPSSQPTLLSRRRPPNLEGQFFWIVFTLQSPYSHSRCIHAPETYYIRAVRGRCRQLVNCPLSIVPCQLMWCCLRCGVR